MNGRAQSFPLSKLSKFPHNKKAGPRRNQNACEGRCKARLRDRPLRGGRKKIKKNPPKNGSSPLAFDGALRESPLRKKQREQAKHLFATVDEKCLIIKEALSLTDQSNKLFLISFLASKIKRLEVARKRRAGFKPTYINHYSFYSFIFQITLRHAHRF